MDKIEYIREEHVQEYRKFCTHHIPGFARPPVAEIWHYTNANGLIGILDSGEVWSTQVACLNDSLEQRYFSSLVHAALKTLRSQNTDADLEILLRIADEALAAANFDTTGHFVTCFSEVEDDLGQWRGYGGGECGYSIGFDFNKVTEAIKSRPSAILLPMSYEDEKHKFLANDVLRMAQSYYLAGLKEGFTDKEKWAREFLFSFARELDIFACVIKHPKFFGEKERRITTMLQPTEFGALEFRQKRTLLARHLPIDLTVPMDGIKRLPITRIFVGPGPSQKVSRVSVGDLLLKHGYKDIKVELSGVPYRVP